MNHRERAAERRREVEERQAGRMPAPAVGTPEYRLWAAREAQRTLALAKGVKQERARRLMTATAAGLVELAEGNTPASAGTVHQAGGRR
jgi:hypothetical protein